MKQAITQPRTGNQIRSSKVAIRRTEMRQRLLAIGAELFVDRGIANVSVEELIEAGGISRATFYGFFANKSELAASILMPVFDSGCSALDGLQGLPPAQAAEKLVDVYLQLWGEHRLALLMTGQLEASLFAYIEVPHRKFGQAIQHVLRAIESAGLLRNGNADMTYMVLAKTGIPLLRVYQDREDFEAVYRDSMLALLFTDHYAVMPVNG
jgi:AcrR family transcriptional regulator